MTHEAVEKKKRKVMEEELDLDDYENQVNDL
jgi:cell division protein FtsL